MTPKEYLELYKRRCDLIGGTTVENCAFWAVTLAGIEDKAVIKEVKNVYRQWGKMMQMVNDLSDFAVFLNKKVDMDFIRYTDIRAGKITLPFYFILKDLKEKEKINRTIEWIGHKEKQQLDDFFAPYLQKDSTILTEVFNIILEEWKICKSEKTPYISIIKSSIICSNQLF